jgi:hypothetical protein
MWRKIVLAQVVAWSLVAAGVARAEDQGSIIDPNGGSSKTVKSPPDEPPPPPGGVIDPNG